MSTHSTGKSFTLSMSSSANLVLIWKALMTALYMSLHLFSTLKFPALEHLLQMMQPSPLPRSHPCLTSFLLVIHFYSSLIFPFISYLGPFLCNNCSDMHPTPFCPKDCNSSALTCSYRPHSTAIWPCDACFRRQQAAKFSPSDPPSHPFSPVCIDILTGGPYGASPQTLLTLPPVNYIIILLSYLIDSPFS